MKKKPNKWSGCLWLGLVILLLLTGCGSQTGFTDQTLSASSSSGGSQNQSSSGIVPNVVNGKVDSTASSSVADIAAPALVTPGAITAKASTVSQVIDTGVVQVANIGQSTTADPPYQGSFNVASSGPISFYVEPYPSHCGPCTFKVSVDGQVIINSPALLPASQGNSSFATMSSVVTIPLTAGNHSITVVCTKADCDPATCCGCCIPGPWARGGSWGALVTIATPQPTNSISILNATPPPPLDATSGLTNLNFDIAIVNATLKGWSVDLEQNHSVIRNFLPGTDPRGPGVGTASGTNTTHVNLPWNGLDANNQRVTGNVTWVMTANTTNFVSGGNPNDGIDSSQIRLDSYVPAASAPTIREISSETVTMLDVNNKPIKTPQYNIDNSRHEPMTIPFRARTATLVTFISVKFGPEDPPVTYYIWGEDDQGNILCPQTASRFDRLDSGHYVTFPIILSSQVKMIPKMKWFYLDPKEGTGHSIGTTDSPIYVTLDTPWLNVKQPRVDVVDFAVRLAEAEQAKDELSVLGALTRGINQRSNYIYDLETTEAHHTRNTRDGQVLRVSNFIRFTGNKKVDPYGNCQDFSNLLQVSAASMGVKNFAFRVIGAKDRRGKRSSFYVFPVKPLGLDVWYQPPDGKAFTFHQAGFYFPNGRPPGPYFDPTYTLNKNSPVLPVNMDEENYKSLFFDAERSKPALWDPQQPDVPVSVE